MGYNILNAKKVEDKTWKKRLDSVILDMSMAVNSDCKIAYIDQDIAYALQLQKERLRKKGLSLYTEIQKREITESHIGQTWNDAHYTSNVCFTPYKINTKVTRGEKIIWGEQRKCISYTTITDVINGAKPDNDGYSCPNCAAVSTVEELQKGCPYCGTKFDMDDIYPKVTGQYVIKDAIGDAKDFKIWALTAMAIGAILANIWFFHNATGKAAEEIQTIFGAILHIIFMGVIGGIAGYVAFAVGNVLKLITMPFTMMRENSTVGSRNRFETRMKTLLNPEFSYEYFMSKVNSLIKTAVFSENEEALLYYTGENLDPAMKNIIDLDFDGAMGVSKIAEEGNQITVEAYGFYDVLYAKGNKIYKKTKQRLRATLHKRIDVQTTLNYSMSKIQCKNCGGSYNAIQNKYCPYCGSEYDIATDDWTMSELRY